MQIEVNGTAHQVEDDLSVSALVQQLGLAGKRIAVEVNLEIVSRSGFDQHILQSGDRVEIVHAIGGG